MTYIQVPCGQQPSKRDFNLLNLQTTTRYGQSSSKFCADQQQPGFQTRPRQAAGVGTEMRCDRPGQARLVQTDQPGDLWQDGQSHVRCSTGCDQHHSTWNGCKVYKKYEIQRNALWIKCTFLSQTKCNSCC